MGSREKMVRREPERAISYHSFQELCGKGSQRERDCDLWRGSRIRRSLFKVGGITASLYPDRNDSARERGNLTLQERDGRIKGVLFLNRGDSILSAKHSAGPPVRAWTAHPSQRRKGRDYRHRSGLTADVEVGAGGRSHGITDCFFFLNEIGRKVTGWSGNEENELVMEERGKGVT